MINITYSYAIEDGQFSHSFVHEKLLGKEGDKITFNDVEFYILCIDGHHVQCLGNVVRDYPSNNIEHEKLKKEFLALADNLGDYL